jgi:hypothetical protein
VPFAKRTHTVPFLFSGLSCLQGTKQTQQFCYQQHQMRNGSVPVDTAASRLVQGWGHVLMLYHAALLVCLPVQLPVYEGHVQATKSQPIHAGFADRCSSARWQAHTAACVQVVSAKPAVLT